MLDVHRRGEGCVTEEPPAASNSGRTCAAGTGAREDCAAPVSAARRFRCVEELDDVRECLSRLSFAFTDLLGNQPDPVVAAGRLDELAGIAREVGDLCERQAKRMHVVDGNR